MAHLQVHRFWWYLMLTLAFLALPACRGESQEQQLFNRAQDSVAQPTEQLATSQITPDTECPVTLVLPGPADHTAYAASLAALEAVGEVTDHQLAAILPLTMGELRFPCQHPNRLATQVKEAMHALNTPEQGAPNDPVAGLQKAVEKPANHQLVLVTTTPIADNDPRVRDVLLPHLVRGQFQVNIAGPDTSAARSITETTGGHLLNSPTQDPLAALRLLETGLYVPSVLATLPPGMVHSLALKAPESVIFALPTSVKIHRVFDPTGQPAATIQVGELGNSQVVRFTAARAGEYQVLLSEVAPLTVHHLPVPDRASLAPPEGSSSPWWRRWWVWVSAIVPVGILLLYAKWKGASPTIPITLVRRAPAAQEQGANSWSRETVDVGLPDPSILELQVSGNARVHQWEVNSPLAISGDPALEVPKMQDSFLILPVQLDASIVKVGWFTRNGHRAYVISTGQATVVASTGQQDITVSPNQQRTLTASVLELAVESYRLRLSQV